MGEYSSQTFGRQPARVPLLSQRYGVREGSTEVSGQLYTRSGSKWAAHYCLPPPVPRTSTAGEPDRVGPLCHNQTQTSKKPQGRGVRRDSGRVENCSSWFWSVAVSRGTVGSERGVVGNSVYRQSNFKPHLESRSGVRESWTEAGSSSLQGRYRQPYEPHDRQHH